MNSTTLIKELPKGLLKWYPFEKDKIALLITSNALTDESYKEMLMECSLKIDCISVFDMISEAVKNNEKYDYIISVASIEKVHEPEVILEKLKLYARPDTKLLLGLNNRLGLRYFCGDRDPYTERNFDSIENYKQAYTKAEDTFKGVMYDKVQITQMLKNTGWPKYKFFSVLPDLDNPTMIFAEDYTPNEDLANRVFPTYNKPDVVFLEEQSLYQQLIDNNIFHKMANAYFVECTLDGELCDVTHVTSSLERGRDDALFTIIHKSGIVEKKAAYPEGKKRLEELLNNNDKLKSNGIEVLDAELDDDSYKMPYMEAEVGQVYLKRLLKTDKNKFLEEMDKFKDLIMKSSQIVEQDKGDGEGAILKQGFLDMVPLNSFHINDTFVFFDQEFCVENYPANILIWRMVATFYSGDMEVNKILPINELLERYDLNRNLSKWQKAEWDFLRKLRKENELQKYHKNVRADSNIINSNRQRMNYSAEDYQRLFIDIFKHADTRKLILFGSGNFTKKFLALYGKDYPVYSIVDNNESRWGQELDGIQIQSPQILKELQSGEYKVIICIKNYVSVMKQLDELGVGDYSIYDWNKDYPRKLNPIQTDKKTETNEPKKYHIGYVAGAFDMFHIGHLNLLRRAKELCDYLIVGVISDETIFELKNKKPIIPCNERVQVVAGCRYVDQAEALPANYAGIRDAYKMFHFDCQFTGDDHGDDEGWLAEKEYLKKQGADIVFFPYTKETSSTQIRDKLKSC